MSTSAFEEATDGLVGLILCGTVIAATLTHDDAILLMFKDGRQVYIASPMGELGVLEERVPRC